MNATLIWCLLIATTLPAATAPDHALFSALLGTHVKDGRVDYLALASDARLSRYLAQLGDTDPASLPDDPARLAFWLNAYNAYTLQLIVERQPKDSIKDIGTGGIVLGSILKTTAWDIRFATVGGKKYTLNEIEHEIIRAQFKDARAHFALNCASSSCPILRPEAYEASKLGDQLEDQARLFIGDPTRNRFDVGSKTAWLSAIFSWYKSDFGRDDRAVLLAAARHAPPEVRRSIEADPAAWTVRHLGYDWSLNSAKP